MRPFEERTGLSEADVLFTSLKTQALQITKHPFFPRERGNLIIRCIQASSLVKDEEFVREVWKDSDIRGTTAAAKKEQESVTRFSNGLATDDGRILLRRSIYNDQEARDIVPGLFFEEVAHLYRPKGKEVSLTALPGNSPFLFGRKKDTVLPALRGASQYAFGQVGNFSEKDIVLKTKGFYCYYQDVQSRKCFSIGDRSSIAEEARAAILQMCLQSIYFGQLMLKSEKPAVQVQRVLAQYEKALAESNVGVREAAAMEFFHAHRYKKDIPKMYEHIFDVMYQSYDLFVTKITEAEKKAFSTACDYIAQEPGRVG